MPIPTWGRRQWLFKWLLAIPHFIVLFFLWIGLVPLDRRRRLRDPLHGPLLPAGSSTSTSASSAGRGASASVSTAHSARTGTRRFSLADDPAYPATLEVDYPEQLSRGLVLVKWWLLAIPQYLIVGIFTGGAWSAWSGEGDGWLYATERWPDRICSCSSPGLSLLFTGRYPRSLYDFVARPEPLGSPESPPTRA